MSNDLVGYSRAGDAFHYRWAARRCLRLIYPNSLIKNICIEGSLENDKAGEYVIDVSEYSTTTGGQDKIDYYQLKHTTVQDNPFILSDFNVTLTGFAKRWQQHTEKNSSEIVSFNIITNRKIAAPFRKNLLAIVNKEKVSKTFRTTIEQYTGFKEDELVSFCRLINLEDGEGNYNLQKIELRYELAQLIAGTVDNQQVDSLVALVGEKVLPNSDGKINKEEVLKRFGITYDRDIYPAPAVWEESENVIEREQYQVINQKICSSLNSVIVHAAGGMGKSVFCRQLINTLPDGSFGIAYDCFGAGSYRNRSEARHRHKDALVQIANELAAKGLCEPLLVLNGTTEKDIMQKFLLRLQTSVKSLRKVSDTAYLFIVIDAADNAEMAAKESFDSCFAHELLRETMPDGCKLVFLCRTERIHLLDPKSNIVQVELEPFTEEETQENLRKWFTQAQHVEGIEFHRLTSGNPRVQANALEAKYHSARDLLSSLGPLGTSVDEQIEAQLNNAISKIEDLLPEEFRGDIKSICLGLASLPPHIPIEVLSRASGVTTYHIKSFVSDIGRSLWLSDTSIQFRDEPTETWFRRKYLAAPNDWINYINILEPIAHQSTYVAEVLPQLYLQAEQYDKLIELALSDSYLPVSNPMDARNVRVFRLQFAFKAALKSKCFKDAVKLAMRAGEAVAGNQRQLVLFKANIDLLVTLQSKEKVQEIAFKRELKGKWNGSENVYTASLLSGITDYKGEARSYLRAAIRWLEIYYNERAKDKLRKYEDELDDKDILELAFAIYSIFGVKKCVQFLKDFTSKEWKFGIVQNFTKRLIDSGSFEAVNDFLQNCKDDAYFTVAVTSELISIGSFPEKSIVEACLDLLCSSKKRIVKPVGIGNDNILPSIVSFAETCLYHELSSQKIFKILEYYIPIKATQSVSSTYSSTKRALFLKALAIRKILSGEEEVDIREIYPKEIPNDLKNHEYDNDFKEFKEVVHGLFPWYLLRAKILHEKNVKLLDVISQTEETSEKARVNSYRSHDILPQEIADICASIMIFYSYGTQEEISDFFQKFLQYNNAFNLQDKLSALRSAHRMPHLTCIRQHLESSSYELIKTYRNESTEEISNLYISLARAVLIASPDDASVYFNDAVNIASKFGDEIVQRWVAVASLAKRACEEKSVPDELAYRFIRCAELVGENVIRERHWDRSEAVSICTRMSPGIGISALSRWLDRDIGWFAYQFEAVLKELICSKVITSATGWSLTRFFSHLQDNEILSNCLENEQVHNIRQSIFDDSVNLLRAEGTSEEKWKVWKNVADKHSLNSESLNTVIEFYNQKEIDAIAESDNGKSSSSKIDFSDKKWSGIFEGIIIHTYEGFSALIQRFKSKTKEEDFGWQLGELLNEVINRIEENSLFSFIDVIFLSDVIDHYYTKEILNSIYQKWGHKVSIKNRWPDIIYRLGEKFSLNLANSFSFVYFSENLNLDKDLIACLKKGVISGLAKVNEFAHADNFFGFVNLASPSIEMNDAIELTAYSLSRFELHMDNGFGDGVWSDWLHVTGNINKNVAGFIWAALGSPRSEIRWKAAHCIRKLAEYNCVEVIDALIDWLKLDKVGAFGSKQYPFYNLHARQYLLIAFARISIEKPEIFLKHRELFPNYALSDPHILIQKFAADIALKIEDQFPETYEKDQLMLISNVGKSKLPIQESNASFSIDGYKYPDEEMLHKDDSTFKFSWDFNQYWYKPLGEVFGVSSKQVQNLASEVINSVWEFTSPEGYIHDPRAAIWSRSPEERAIRHSHGSYPRIDELDFYLSYHAMFVVASLCLEKMPVITDRYSSKNPWDDWLSNHLLTRDDGKWLADSRGELPLNRPLWISKEKKDSWQTGITEENFLNCLKTEYDGELWINAAGRWHEQKNDYTETFSISTALVSKKTSNALLRTLEDKRQFDYGLPYLYEENREEVPDVFHLMNWVYKSSASKFLDEHDPYANEVEYPPYSLASKVIEAMGLKIENEGNYVYFENTQKSVSICKSWCSYKEKIDDKSDQFGMQLKVSLPFLKLLCITLNSNVVFDISIERNIYHRYNRDKNEYSEPQHKTFIFSEDGKLRTTETDYQLG